MEAAFRIAAVGDAAFELFRRIAIDFRFCHGILVLLTAPVVDRHRIEGVLPVVVFIQSDLLDNYRLTAVHRPAQFHRHARLRIQPQPDLIHRQGDAGRVGDGEISAARAGRGAAFDDVVAGHALKYFVDRVPIICGAARHHGGDVLPDGMPWRVLIVEFAAATVGCTVQRDDGRGREGAVIFLPGRVAARFQILEFQRDGGGAFFILVLVVVPDFLGCEPRNFQSVFSGQRAVIIGIGDRIPAVESAARLHRIIRSRLQFLHTVLAAGQVAVGIDHHHRQARHGLVGLR